MRQQKLRVAVFVSGEGNTLQALLDRQAEYHYEICLVVADRACNALGRAERAGVPTLLTRDWEKTDQALEEYGIQLSVLAGFLSIVPERICLKREEQIINTHPALLPKYGGKGMYGLRVQEAVLAAGETETGCTIHFVGAGVDTGEIIARAKVDVRPDDTPESLLQRVQAEERVLLPLTVERFALQVSEALCMEAEEKEQ